jgi:cytochrome c553
LRALVLGSILAVVLALGVLASGCKVGQSAKAARGAELFKTCVPCHAADGAGILELRTPSIAGLPEWYLKTELTKFATDVRGAHPDDNEGHRMRPMARTLYHPGDLDAVAAYVGGLPRPRVKSVLAGNVAAGKKTFAAMCITCHGPAALGNQTMSAPPLAGQSDWYLVAQLVKFKTGMRGGSSLDATGMVMRAMSTTVLPDTNAMHDVVAYIRTLSN